ncbi:MAG TPA: histidine kinase [Terriglobales bacterium]|nr:histidine kinase [Terriglobales bacterium]
MIVLSVASILALTTAIECHSVAVNAEPWIPLLLYGAVLWLWWAVVIDLLWRAGKYSPFVLSVSLKNAGIQLFITVAVALLHLSVLHNTVHLITRLWVNEKSAYIGLDFFNVGRFGVEFLLYGLIWSACTALNTQFKSQRDAMKSIELERQLSIAHLRALQMQLEPHFLFNTLNAVTTLVELDRTKEAVETLAHLNTILKTGLKRNTPSKISLAQELEIVESYLSIERVRFADRLHVNINIDPHTLDGMVPCFLLQPIIENAIRHGIAQCEDQGYIETSARREGNHLRLEVRDNGPGLKASALNKSGLNGSKSNGNGTSHSGFGIGLTNTRERLAHFYQDDYAFDIRQPESGGFEVAITIPYERQT